MGVGWKLFIFDLLKFLFFKFFDVEVFVFFFEYDVIEEKFKF